MLERLDAPDRVWWKEEMPFVPQVIPNTQPPLDKGEMSVEDLIAKLQKLPPGTKMMVQAGGWGDDAYVPNIRVWLYQGRVVEASIEVGPDHYHYNYPEGYSGVVEITQQIYGPNKEENA